MKIKKIIIESTLKSTFEKTVERMLNEGYEIVDLASDEKTEGLIVRLQIDCDKRSQKMGVFIR